MFKYGADNFNDGNKELITEFLNSNQDKNEVPIYTENIKYPFINSLWVDMERGKNLYSRRKDTTQQGHLMNVWNS
ncbi:MAG: hypothetical protein LUH47_00175 [Clostridiales bacterium]|nr:hypothetical protein [Clostridiales bacterium]